LRNRKSRRKIRPANEVSESEIDALSQAIKDFDGYPRLRDLGRMVPSLTPLKINVIIRYLERSGAILVDTESYIVWARKDQERLTLGEVGKISADLKDYLEKRSE
jgi:hypothetical protein